MLRLLRLCCFLLFLGAANLQAQSELFIDSTNYTADQMIMDFFDNFCVTPSNINFQGNDAGKAFFIAADTDLGVPAGIILSSGNVQEAANEASFFASSSLNELGDTDLEALVNGGVTFDASVLSFDMTVSTADTLSFRYVFASEEYPEFVDSDFNDVFAFFIEDSTGQMVNIATLPDSMEVVAINSVNHLTNSIYYRENSNLQYDPTNPPTDTIVNPDIVYDGMTVVLDAKFYAEPGQNYHVKIGIADVADGVYDSGVFIGINSLCGSDSIVPPAIAEFQLIGDSLVVENLSRYAQSFMWDFDDGTISFERNPGIHVYDQPGEYTVTLTTENYCCTDTYQQTFMVGNPNSVNNPAEEVFTMHPNPVSDQLQLQLKQEGQYNYSILDISGRVILSGQGQGDQILDLESLIPGMYLLQLRLNDGIYSQRLVVE